MKIKYAFFSLSFFCLYLLPIVASSSAWVSSQPLTELVLLGNMQAQIVADQPAAHFYLETPLEQLTTVQCKLDKHSLTIRRFAVGDGPQLVVHVPAELSALTVKGNSTVSLDGLHSREFSLKAYNQGEINVHGVIGLKELVAHGGIINIYWLDTPSLTVFAKGNSRILLGGKVNTLHAYLSGNSFLNTRYLRNQQAYLQTKGKARIDISAQQILQAQAMDHSNIYYYQKPKFLGQYMLQAGSVLNKAGLE